MEMMPSLHQRVSWMSSLWFWVTIGGVFYCGLGHVLPAIYVNYSESFLLFQHVICYFMFAQLIVNWVFVKLTSSEFRPEDHKDYINAHADEVCKGGYEINLNHLKSTSDSSSYTLPVNSIRPMHSSKNADSIGVLPNSTMYVVEIDSDDVTDTRKIIYPYWSWKPCVICQVQRPPRAHHCSVCNKCILKRDHHCFFTNSCVGVRNQRYFIVFNFWTAVATWYCLLHSLVYLFQEFLPRNAYMDLFLPFTLIRWCIGYVTNLDIGMMFLLYSIFWFCLTTTGFFCKQCHVVKLGLTSFEKDNNIKVTNSNSYSENLRGVFGDYWLINFFFPAHLLFSTADDGVHWRGIKP